MEDFIKILKSKLEGEIPARELDNIITYYINYISEDEKVRIKELGDPRLIAKSILDVEGNPDNKKSRRKNVNVDDVYLDHNKKRKKGNNKIIINLSKWYSWLVIALVLIIVLFMVSLIIGTLINIFIRIIIFAIKIIVVFAVPIILVAFIYFAINGKRK